MRKSGYLIIEILISIVIFMTVVVAIFSNIATVMVRTKRSGLTFEAGLLLQEEIEATYNIFLRDWTVYPDGEYYPAINTSLGEWTLLDGIENNVRTRYSRKVEIETVCRRPQSHPDSGKIVDCIAGEVDLNSKLIRGVVEWVEKGENKKVETEILLVRTNI